MKRQLLMYKGPNSIFSSLEFIGIWGVGGGLIKL